MSFSEQVALDNTASAKHTLSALDSSDCLIAAKRQRRDILLVRQILELASKITFRYFVESQIAIYCHCNFEFRRTQSNTFVPDSNFYLHLASKEILLLTPKFAISGSNMHKAKIESSVCCLKPFEDSPSHRKILIHTKSSWFLLANLFAELTRCAAEH
jgi:hypothetical protein